MLNTTPSSCWIIDFEFQVVKDYLPIPYEISVRDISGTSILHTLIDWECSVRDMIDTVKFTWPLNRAGHTQAFKMGFQKHYGTNLDTKGQTVQQIRQTLLAAGYNGQQVLVSWATNLDQQLFESIINDNSPSFLRKPLARTPQQINVFTICKQMRAQPTQKMAPDKIHPRICPATNITGYHRAKNDTAALCEVIAVMVSLLRADEVARMANLVANGGYTYQHVGGSLRPQWVMFPSTKSCWLAALAGVLLMYISAAYLK